MSPKMSENSQPMISPTEDLMREHGVLRRILLIYDEVKCYLKSETVCQPSFIYQVIIDTAQIAERFIEDYHQKLEEEGYRSDEHLRHRIEFFHCSTSSILTLNGGVSYKNKQAASSLKPLVSDRRQKYTLRKA